MQSGVRKLNPRNMFYSEIFTARKNHANTRECVPARAAHRQLSRKCGHIVATTWSLLCWSWLTLNQRMAFLTTKPLSLSIPSQAIIHNCSSQSQSRRRRLLQTTRARNVAHTYCCCPYFLISVVASNTVWTLPWWWDHSCFNSRYLQMQSHCMLVLKFCFKIFRTNRQYPKISYTKI